MHEASPGDRALCCHGQAIQTFGLVITSHKLDPRFPHACPHCPCHRVLEPVDSTTLGTFLPMDWTLKNLFRSIDTDFFLGMKQARFVEIRDTPRCTNWPASYFHIPLNIECWTLTYGDNRGPLETPL